MPVNSDALRHHSARFQRLKLDATFDQFVESFSRRVEAENGVIKPQGQNRDDVDTEAAAELLRTTKVAVDKHAYNLTRPYAESLGPTDAMHGPSGHAMRATRDEASRAQAQMEKQLLKLGVDKELVKFAVDSVNSYKEKALDIGNVMAAEARIDRGRRY